MSEGKSEKRMSEEVKGKWTMDIRSKVMMDMVKDGYLTKSEGCA